MLKNKKILLFLGGSIAVYKSLLLIRSLIKEEAEIRVIASSSALKFITRLSIETLSKTVLLTEDSECWHTESNVYTPNHINYAKWADIALFAPITANSLNKLAHGIADNIYLSSALALPDIPKLLAPSANTQMLENPITQASIQTLQQNGYTIIPSQEGNLACGEIGNGAMADIEEITFALKKAVYTRDFWRNKKVLITGGGSSENIDSIRCITNHSSGLQACNLALALYFLGAKVSLISSQIPLKMPNDITIIKVYSSKDYLDSLQQQIAQNNTTQEKIYLFMAAAISDYIPHSKQGKIKKREMGPTMWLELYENIDILQTLNEKNLIKIAFKAECDTDNAKRNAVSLLDSKNCAMVCLNIIANDNKAFGSENNTLYVLHKKSEVINTTHTMQLEQQKLERLISAYTNIHLKDSHYAKYSLNSTSYNEYQISGNKFTISLALAMYIEFLHNDDN
ncbi:bifunctional phosphopantothenoylcysteine decarboxylase/phosphopantothenate--cysteine ligase CoaBC [Helicobacter aurati]|uniref:Coenzyme A biosynthesis bifunctional protein CoaBC n=1 Tax=Helicobacter aurati TaxID=137778 RepID=A0A3D8J7B0_9HELI|nr:bifunctional phosphopantothenoylcysteine decarboxylase/phosphopantothenate--cysteine ligase CoaBC [Helicobacter aurati]RDU73387.1 bifunctional phosphopantothenoylcysteine decarboxylase/phosphopantothenate--cysteine ligase CoaBC [Helicobacter aurati]